jgi:hypothetical protein
MIHWCCPTLPGASPWLPKQLAAVRRASSFLKMSALTTSPLARDGIDFISMDDTIPTS